MVTRVASVAPRWRLAITRVVLAGIVFATAFGIGLPVRSGLYAVRPLSGTGMLRSSNEHTLPLAFELNRGQADARVLFVAHGSGYTLFLTRSEAVVVAQAASNPTLRQSMDSPGRPLPASHVSAVVLHLHVVGSGDAQATGQDRLPGVVNYLIGRDRRHWHTDIPTYAKVAFRHLRPGISLVYYGTRNHLEYDVVVDPGAQADGVAFDVTGTHSMRLDRAGDLLLSGPNGTFVQERPTIYQIRAGRRRIISGRYVLSGPHRVSVQVGAYDRRRPLVIDPVLLMPLGGGTGVTSPTVGYATYLGGSNLDDCLGLAVDGSGAAYIVGQTGSVNFPTKNAAQAVYHGGGDAFVAKLNPSGSALIYSTYLGGSGYEFGTAIAVDGKGQAYVTGYTTSVDFPVAHALLPTYQGNYDGFVAALNVAGDGLVYSTYLGGKNPDGGFDIAVDRTGAADVVGTTRSSNFLPHSALAGTLHGPTDAFVVRLAPNGHLIYGTFLGGSSGDDGVGVTTDSAGNTYVIGATLSHDWPLKNALQAAYAGGFDDAVVAKLSPAGHIMYSTYLGGHGSDRGQAIAVDSTGNAYVTLETNSPDLPLRQAAQAHYGGGKSDVYMAKLSADGRTLLFGTYLGGNGSDTPYGIAVDSVGYSYVTGITRSLDFPHVHALQAIERTTGPRADAFVAKLDPAGSVLIFSTTIGGLSNDFGTGIALDTAGNAYVSGETNSLNLPVVNALQPKRAGNYDAFVVKINHLAPSSAVP